MTNNINKLILEKLNSFDHNKISSIESIKENSQKKIQKLCMQQFAHNMITVAGKNLFFKEFFTLKEALKAIKEDHGTDYIIFLHSDVKLEYNQNSNFLILPHKNITINGNGFCLSQSTDFKSFIFVYGHLVFENIKLKLEKTILFNYGEKTIIEMNGYVTGQIKQIIDKSLKKQNKLIIHAPAKKSMISSIDITSYIIFV